MNRPLWLVYMLIPCEQGSEGYSGWAYYAVVEGDYDPDIYESWVKEVKHLYGVDLSEDLKMLDNGTWACRYCQLAKTLLPTNVYGRSKPLEFFVKFEPHLY